MQYAFTVVIAWTIFIVLLTEFNIFICLLQSTVIVGKMCNIVQTLVLIASKILYNVQFNFTDSCTKFAIIVVQSL